MSLPAALTVASHQGQTGQQCVVYPTVKNKKSLSFFLFFFSLFLLKPSLAATNKKHIGHFSQRSCDPPLQHNSPEIQNS